MKKILCIAAVLIFAVSMKIKAESPPFQSVGFGIFYSELAPYGNWIELNGGLTVWQPYNTRTGWMPYTQGRWIWTADGWYWDSYEPYGYIVFHYGRWYYDNYYGWIWIPDYQWAPAWVQWRYDNDYIGWSPLPPYANFSIYFGIRFSTHFVTPYHHWHFVRYRHFCDPYVHKYYVGHQYKYRIFSHTKYRTNYGYYKGRVINRGVNIDYIRQKSGQRITERKIQTVHDSREFLRDHNARNENRNRNEVRAFIPSRDQMNRTEKRDFVIKRGERRSSLDINRVKREPRREIRRNEPGSIRNNRNIPRNDRPKVYRNERNSRGSSIENPGRRNNHPQMQKPREERPRSFRKSAPREQRPSYNRPQRGQRNEIRRENRRSSPPQMRRDSRGNHSSRDSRNSDQRIRRR